MHAKKHSNGPYIGAIQMRAGLFEFALERILQQQLGNIKL
jgi:hypothetical protein